MFFKPQPGLGPQCPICADMLVSIACQVGGVCSFFKQNIPIKRRQDLELIQETIVSEISLGRKKIFFVVVYRSPNQSSEEFNIFQESLHCIILTDDFNCRSRQWWRNDVDS